MVSAGMVIVVTFSDVTYPVDVILPLMVWIVGYVSSTVNVTGAWEIVVGLDKLQGGKTKVQG